MKVSVCAWASRLRVAQGGCCPRQGTEWKLGRARLPSQGHTETALCPSPHFSPEHRDHVLWREAAPGPRGGRLMRGVGGV